MDTQTQYFLSTGALVERRNNYNYNEIMRVVPYLQSEKFIDGAELMVIKLWYEKFPALLSDFLREGCIFPVIHSDKDIGTALSDAALLHRDGDLDGAKKRKAESLDMFKKCCEWGQAAGATRMVLHLWGGLSSDKAVQYNIETLPEMIEIARPYGVRVMCENVPSSLTDPLSNWLSVKRYMKEDFEKIGLVFDTRFATCHRQPGETLSNQEIFSHIEHVHISDYRGGLKDFSCLRPVFHPGEGIADYDLMFEYFRKKALTYTLESPAITGSTAEKGETNTEALKKSLSFIRDMSTK